MVVVDASYVDELGKIKWTTYPPNGFVIPDPPSKTLEVGAVIDRYGGPYGSFTSPVGTPFVERALPYIDNPGAYHKYRVIKPIEAVKYGEIAPAFDQPGGGIQHKLPGSILELKEYLEKYGNDDQKLCISDENNKWLVFYSERGSRFNITEFDKEDDACDELLKRIMKLLDYGKKHKRQ